MVPSSSHDHGARSRSFRAPLTPSAWVLITLLGIASASAAPEQETLLAQQLRHGGYVLVMRHAQSPEIAPAARAAEPDNVGHERQLSEAGKAGARALGDALHALHVPIGPIYSSPTYRALQTIRLAGLAAPQSIAQLAEGHHGMSGSAGRAEAQWLRRAVMRPPPAGSNTLIVTHTPNIVGAFGQAVMDIKAGEMVVFKPESSRPASMIGRITIDEWQRLARQH